MDDSKWERWSALGGIAFVVLILIAVFLPGSPPKTSDSVAKIAKFVSGHRDELRWSAYVGGLGTIALVWWLGAVWRVLRRAEGGEPRLTVVALAGAVFAAVMNGIGGVLLAAVAILGVPGSGGASGTRFFYVLSANLAAAGGFGVALFVGAFSAVVIRSGAMPRALGWAGGIIALVTVVGAASVSTTRDVFFVLGLASIIGFVLWVVAVSVLMYRGAPRQAASTSAA